MTLIRSLLIAVGLVCLQLTSFPLSLFSAEENGESWEELQTWVQSLEEEETSESSPPGETQTVREVPALGGRASEEAPIPETPSTPVIIPETPPPQSSEAQIIEPAIISAPPESREAIIAKPVTSPSGTTVSSTGGYSFGSSVAATPSGATASAPAVKKPRERRREKKDEKPPENIYADHFFLNPDQKIQYQTSETAGFVFVESSGPGGQPDYSIVTDFGGNVVRTQKIPGADSLDAARKHIEEHLEVSEFEGVEVRKLTLSSGPEESKTRFWVGHKSFLTPDEAFAEIAMIKTASQAKGLDFTKMVGEAQAYVGEPEKDKPIEINAPANFEKEEKMMLKMMDGLDIGEKMFGPFTGETSGEKIVWQSFGETSWRRTNLESLGYSEQAGFWTNRIVFKGLRAPLSTIDPFVESTIAMESDGVDFKDNMKLWAGLEWRPLSTNPWLYNYRPYGLPLLEWVRNYRFYVMYGDRINLKDEIGGSYGYDLHWGVQIFYEFGIDLPGAGEGTPETPTDFLRQYVWGEYFGNYRAEMTGFSAEENPNNVLLNSNFLLGVRLPGIPLPANPINDELVLMPYMRFEHVNSTQFSFPFQNQYFVAAGVRWMPFRTYRFKENEWLSKVKVFGEYVGVGLVQHAKQDGEAPNAVRYDFRFGVNISSRRF